MQKTTREFAALQEVRIEDWFDPRDTAHLIAYKRLQDDGVWPEDFIPKFVVLGGNWLANLNTTIANAYMEDAVIKVGLSRSKVTPKKDNDVVVKLSEIRDAFEAECRIISDARSHVDSLLEDLEVLRDEFDSVCDDVNTVDDFMQDGLSALEDAIVEITSASESMSVI